MSVPTSKSSLLMENNNPAADSSNAINNTIVGANGNNNATSNANTKDRKDVKEGFESAASAVTGSNTAASSTTGSNAMGSNVSGSHQNTSSNKDQAITTLISTIKELSVKHGTEVANIAPFFQSHQFLFSNENFCNQKIGVHLNQLTNTCKTATTINVAILNGESHFLSYLSILSRSIDLIIFYDINEHLRELIQILWESMENANTIVEYKIIFAKKIKDSPLLKSSAEYLIITLDLQSKLVGDDFFLTNEQQFGQCKTALKNIKWVFYHANILQKSHIDALLSSFETANKSTTSISATNIGLKVQVKLLNITNLKEYCNPDTDSNNRELEHLQYAVTQISANNNPLILFSALYKGDTLQSKGWYPCYCTKNPNVSEHVIKQSDVWDSDMGTILSSKDPGAILNAFANMGAFKGGGFNLSLMLPALLSGLPDLGDEDADGDEDEDCDPSSNSASASSTFNKL